MIDLDQIKLEQINDYKAIQLITFVSQNNKFELNSEAAQFLSQLRGNIAFVVVCGKYRTGKSFLLNKLIDVQNEGFSVSPATNSCTQGIWLYTKPLINKQSNLQIYFLDTEGSESGVKSQTHDAKIFALAILMSSTFMFNSIGCIDEQSIIQLHLTTLLSKNIQVQDHDNSNNENILGYYTPKFIWLLRDFVLEMKDGQNRKITPKEYLELALHDDRQYQSENSKKVRKTLLTCFKDRNCFQLVRPVINENELQKVNQLPNNQLREEFQQQVIQLREYLLKNTSPKQLNGVNLNGRMFCKMIETFITNFNKGKIPIISTAWEHVVETECQQGLVQAKQLYETNLKKYFGSDEAKSFEEIFQILKKIRDESFQTFHYIAGIREKNNHFEEYKKKLLDFMTEKENLAIRLNDDMNNTKNEEVIAEVSQKLKENLDQETFTIDNLEVFFQHFNEFLTAYDKKSAGTEKANTLIHFLQNHHPIIVKQLVNSVVQKYSKNKNQAEEEKAVQQVKEKQLLDNIKILELNIAQHETKIKKLDQDKVQLEAQKKQLSDQLSKLQTENKTIRDNIKDVDELQNMIAQKNEEIQGLKKIITSLQTKKKKGCCG
ncbi:unnamed protein product [Paramecium primaurelia]|uniref:GB1/RHD3-type G domain-containing protein n=1 Tax=Paramecium primaurelia TaxID=5886 RepID=A0A8S1PAD2_PARPR|nr:unnamed protein product [Paramecium primaurelia]